MNYFAILFLSVFILGCTSETAEESILTDSPTEITSDTLQEALYDSLMVFHEFANSPFHEKDDFLYFEGILQVCDSITKIAEVNQYDSEVIDTITTFYWGTSRMSKTRNNFMQSDLMESVIITDNSLKLRNGIGVGDSEKSVFEAFDLEFDPKKNYSFIQMEAGDATNFLVIYFTNRAVSRIVYWPYTG